MQKVTDEGERKQRSAPKPPSQAAEQNVWRIAQCDELQRGLGLHERS